MYRVILGTSLFLWGFCAASWAQDGKTYDQLLGEYKQEMTLLARRFRDDPRSMNLAAQTALKQFTDALLAGRPESEKDALEIWNETLKRYTAAKSLFDRPEERNLRRQYFQGIDKVCKLEIQAARDVTEEVPGVFWFEKFLICLKRAQSGFEDDPDIQNFLGQNALQMLRLRIPVTTYSTDSARVLDNLTAAADRAFPIDGPDGDKNKKFNALARGAVTLLFRRCAELESQK